MVSATDSLVLKGAHVIDPEQGIDRVADVHLAGDKIEFVGSREIAPTTKVVDVSGHYLSAGWVDIAKQHRDMLRYNKSNAIGDYESGRAQV